jgi:hypothetical protein
MRNVFLITARTDLGFNMESYPERYIPISLRSKTSVGYIRLVKKYAIAKEDTMLIFEGPHDEIIESLNWVGDEGDVILEITEEDRRPLYKWDARNMLWRRYKV